MLVTLKLTGFIAMRANLKPGEVLQFQLPDDATLADLLSTFDAKMGERMPSNLWNRKTLSFHDSVMMMVNGQHVKDPGTPLQDGSAITALLPMAGG